MASTWSCSVILDRSASADSSPGNVSAVTSWLPARSRAATSSHAHAPSQNPGTRMIGALVIVRFLLVLVSVGRGIGVLPMVGRIDDKFRQESLWHRAASPEPQPLLFDGYTPSGTFASYPKRPRVAMTRTRLIAPNETMPTSIGPAGRTGNMASEALMLACVTIARMRLPVWL